MVNDNEMKLILNVHFKRISLFHGASLSFSEGLYLSTPTAAPNMKGRSMQWLVNDPF
jgi:hypothetical protein